MIASANKDYERNDPEEDHETENSSIFYNFNTPFCTSIQGQNDLNSSFPGSASAVSHRWGTGTDLGGSFVEEDRIAAIVQGKQTQTMQAYQHCSPHH
jgi:hypothetical protein